MFPLNTIQDMLFLHGSISEVKLLIISDHTHAFLYCPPGIFRDFSHSFGWKMHWISIRSQGTKNRAICANILSGMWHGGADGTGVKSVLLSPHTTMHRFAKNDSREAQSETPIRSVDHLSESKLHTPSNPTSVWKCLIKISFLWLLRTFLAGGSDGERDALLRSSLSPPRWPVRLQTLQGSGYCCSVLHLYNRSVAITWVTRPTDFQHCVLTCGWFVQGMNERNESDYYCLHVVARVRGSDSQCRVNIIFLEKEKCCWCTAVVQRWPGGEVEMRVSHVAAWVNYVFLKKVSRCGEGDWLNEWKKK